MNISKAIWISNAYEGALILMPIIALAAYGYSLAFCTISALIMLSAMACKNAVYFRHMPQISEPWTGTSIFPYASILALCLIIAVGYIYLCYLLIAYNGWLVVGILALNSATYYLTQKFYSKLLAV